ncbi:MAG: hypothetical protein A3K77_07580 [Euryarchaeota archaeon RBG_13_31_8]|nr:MAG: hypothetical protein A3K77_07580 [Euryarchaeota archaeon RBG_13_31_8]
MRVYAKRLQIQERMTNQIADAIAKYVSPDVIVVISAEHFCMSIRGIRLPGTTLITTAERGEFKNKELCEKFMQRIGKVKK